MRGLLQKDLCLILQRKQTILIFVLLAFMMGMTQDGAFVICYMCMLSAIFSIGTISYDEFDNGYPFLFTLPITRREYVQSKYLFSLLTALTGWGFSMLLILAIALVRGQAAGLDWSSSAAFLFVPAMIISFMVPVQLKYGAERSRLALALAAGAAIVIAALLGRVSQALGLDNSAFSQLATGVVGILPYLLVIGAVLLLFLSYCWSVRIMEKKEF